MRKLIAQDVTKLDSPKERWRVVDGLPAWLTSMLFHLLALLALAMITLREPPGFRSELALASSTDMNDALDLVEFEIDSPDEAEAPLMIARPSALASPASAETALAPSTLDNYQPTAYPGLDDAFLLADAGGGISRAGNQGYTSLFGLTAAGSDFVYVFDRSGSMNEEFTIQSRYSINKVTPLSLAKTELLGSLKQLNDKCRFQIVFYNNEPLPFGTGSTLLAKSVDEDGLYPSSPAFKTKARNFVTDIKGKGGTNHLTALEKAIHMRPDNVYLITDAQPRDDPPWGKLSPLATYCRKYRIRVNVIHFSDEERPDSTLARLSKATRGAHRFLDLREVAEAMK